MFGIKLALGMIAFFAAVSATASHEVGYLQLSCSGRQTVATQPCGGANVRSVDLVFSSGHQSPQYGYTDHHEYNGCYPMADDEFSGHRQDSLWVLRTRPVPSIRRPGRRRG